MEETQHKVSKLSKHSVKSKRGDATKMERNAKKRLRHKVFLSYHSKNHLQFKKIEHVQLKVDMIGTVLLMPDLF